jgi:CubicO group peptidase (beta-lactamase class C family)
MSMTQPHAAGAIVSTVDDLAKWDAALYTGRLLRQETLQRAFTPHRLRGGREVHYGYGWQPGTWEGFTILQHGGGINGFVSSGVRVPERRVFVAVLSNRIAAPFPIPIAQRIASHLLDKPWQPASVTVAPSALAAYAGKYRGELSEVVTVTVEGGRLYTQGSRGARTEALALSEAEFGYQESMDKLRFEKDSDGRVTALVRQGFGAPPVRLSRAAEALSEPAAARAQPRR